MSDWSDHTAYLSRRTFILVITKFFLMLSLIARLFHLQILQNDKFKALSENNRVKTSLIPPIRGEILDRNGIELATNKIQYRLFLDRDLVKRKAKKILNKIIQLIKLDPKELKNFENKIKNSPRNVPVLLIENLNWNDVAKIEVNSFDLKGLYVGLGYARFYPHSNTCSHLIGYVGAVSEQEIDKSPLLSHPEVKIGKNGIEKTMNEELIGKPGFVKSEVNAGGYVVKELSRTENIPGNNINLSLDIELQNILAEQFKDEGAAAVLLDVKTGEILSMLSTPSYDSNIMTIGISNNEWNSLINNNLLPLTNKTISLTYPPGSVFKLVVCLAALRAGVNPSMSVHCNGQFRVGSRVFHCWKKEGHGHVNMSSGLMGSCNTYFGTIGRMAGINLIHEIGTLLGLGMKSNIALPNENSGILPNDAWKRGRFDIPWQTGDTVNSSIGQGFVQSTILQLAVMTARIASGKMVFPRLLKTDDNIHEFLDLDINNEHLNILRSAMHHVVNSPSGTAYVDRIVDSRYAMAGKTGTSQVISKKNPKEDLSKIGVAREFRNHGLFTAYAPYNNPRFAVSIIAEHAGRPKPCVIAANKVLSLAMKKYKI